MPMPPSPLERLGAFRSELHGSFTRRADALFELGDALLCSQTPFPSLPHLSLEPTHRRGWGSAYAALASGRIDTERLRDLLVSHLPPADPLVFAVDVTTWPRCDAECSPERGYYYHPSRHSAGQPIIAGWAYQLICQLSLDRDSWTARSTRRGCTPWTTPTSRPLVRSARSWHACTPAASHRCSSSMAAMTPPSSPWTWPTCPSRCWCGCAQTAASTPTHHQRRARPKAVGRAATAPSSPSPTRPPGRSRPPPRSARTTSTAPSPSTPGAGCIPSSNAIPATAAEGPGRSCAAPSSASKSSVSPPAPAHRGCCGYGGPAPTRWTSIWRGGRMFAGSIWSTPCGSPSRPLAGPPHAPASPPKPTAGPGWCWPPTPSCASPAWWPRTRGCRGNGLDHSRACHPTGSDEGFRGCCAHSLAGRHAETLRALPRPAQGPALGARDPLPSGQEARQEAKEQAAHDGEGRLTGPARPQCPPTSIAGQPKHARQG
jgi:hypothetical protein